jgi:hypothetical protein
MMASSFSTSEILAVKFIHEVQGIGNASDLVGQAALSIKRIYNPTNIFTPGSAEAIALAKATVKFMNYWMTVTITKIQKWCLSLLLVCRQLNLYAWVILFQR